MGKKSRALVLFSGGQDSATALVWALHRYAQVETIGFDYGQRHGVEMQVRQDFLLALPDVLLQDGVKPGTDHVVDLRGFGALANSSLTAARAIAFNDSGLPDTFVPGRNLAFFVAAAALGYRRGIFSLVGGMCETDYSGYPDCRAGTLAAMNEALRLGMEADFVIETPLMALTKAQTWQMAEELGGQPLADLIVEHTHTCYLGDRAHRHDWGYGCGQCPACVLRARGWDEWQSGS